MFSKLSITGAAASALLFLNTGCVHTPPGTSVNIALARKAELVRLPGPPPAPTVVASSGGNSGGAGAIEPILPEKTERVADAYSRGVFCMGAGKDEEAILAFREAVKVDPGFGEAWNKLAALYEKSGQEKEAMDAFKRSKNSVNGSRASLIN